MKGPANTKRRPVPFKTKTQLETPALPSLTSSGAGVFAGLRAAMARDPAAWWQARFIEAHRPEFITNDPMQLPARYRHHPDPRALELTAWLTALFAYGQRPVIIRTMAGVIDTLAAADPAGHDGVGRNPVEGLLRLTEKTRPPMAIRRFVYRFHTGIELWALLQAMAWGYRQHEALKALWQPEASPAASLGRFHRQLLSAAEAQAGPLSAQSGERLRFLLCIDPEQSAAKRGWMALRWLVRGGGAEDLDFGLWQDILSPAELTMPLDTHVGRISRALGITERRTDDARTAREITDYFRALDPADPVKYDFALMALGTAKTP